MKPTTARSLSALVLAAGLLAATAPSRAQVQVQMQPTSRAPAATPNLGTTLSPQLQLQVQMPGADTGAPGPYAPGPRSRQGAGYSQQPGYGQPGYGQPGPQSAPPPCPDAGSFVVVGPQAARGQPIVAQAWNDCADLPGNGAPQPQIGIDIQISPPQDTQADQSGTGTTGTGPGGSGLGSSGIGSPGNGWNAPRLRAGTPGSGQGGGILLVRPGAPHR